MDLIRLPQEVQVHLPAGYESSPGIWFVLPADNGAQRSIVAANTWLRAEDWYPDSLQLVIWYGDDGVGNFFGWLPDLGEAILWNPEDGDEPWRQGSVSELWQFVLNGYSETT
jgi:hypothetical protein